MDATGESRAITAPPFPKQPVSPPERRGGVDAESLGRPANRRPVVDGRGEERPAIRLLEVVERRIGEGAERAATAVAAEATPSRKGAPRTHFAARTARALVAVPDLHAVPLGGRAEERLGSRGGPRGRRVVSGGAHAALYGRRGGARPWLDATSRANSSREHRAVRVMPRLAGRSTTIPANRAPFGCPRIAARSTTIPANSAPFGHPRITGWSATVPANRAPWRSIRGCGPACPEACPRRTPSAMPPFRGRAPRRSAAPLPAFAAPPPAPGSS